MNPMVEIREVTKHFGRTVALENVTLAIEEGQFFALVGPSGSGKTTLLHILGGFIAPSRGQVFIAGNEVTHLPPSKRPTTSMFQDYALFPHMSVGSNVGFGLRMRKVVRSERRERVKAALGMVGLAGMENRRIDQLSGGQRQRVALARALVVSPKVLLLDEPLGALDLNLRRQMQVELLHIQKKVGTTFVHVTHDQEEAMSIADVIAVMHAGKIEDVGPPSRVYLKPRTLFTAAFMGENNMVPAKVGAASAGSVAVDTPWGPVAIPGEIPAAGEIHLSVRPEQIAVGSPPADGAVPLGKFAVEEITFYGTHFRCQGRQLPSGLPMIVRLPQNQVLAAGAQLPIWAAAEDIVLLSR